MLKIAFFVVLCLELGLSLEESWGVVLVANMYKCKLLSKPSTGLIPKFLLRSPGFARGLLADRPEPSGWTQSSALKFLNEIAPCVLHSTHKSASQIQKQELNRVQVCCQQISKLGIPSNQPKRIRRLPQPQTRQEDYKQLFQIWRRSEDTSDAACAWLQQVGYEKTLSSMCKRPPQMGSSPNVGTRQTSSHHLLGPLSQLLRAQGWRR